MSAFAAPIAEQIWDMKYRLKAADGTPIDGTANSVASSCNTDHTSTSFFSMIRGVRRSRPTAGSRSIMQCFSAAWSGAWCTF